MKWSYLFFCLSSVVIPVKYSSSWASPILFTLSVHLAQLFVLNVSKWSTLLVLPALFIMLPLPPSMLSNLQPHYCMCPSTENIVNPTYPDLCLVEGL